MSIGGIELNQIRGATLTIDELNVLTGITVTTTELNQLTGLTVTVSELNQIDDIIADLASHLAADLLTAHPIASVNGDTLIQVGSLSQDRLNFTVTVPADLVSITTDITNLQADVATNTNDINNILSLIAPGISGDVSDAIQAMNDHLADPADAHNASSISFIGSKFLAVDTTAIQTYVELSSLEDLLFFEVGDFVQIDDNLNPASASLEILSIDVSNLKLNLDAAVGFIYTTVAEAIVINLNVNDVQGGLDRLDNTSSTTIVNSAQDRGTKLIEGGDWTYNAGANELSFTADAYVRISGLTDVRNTIPLSESPITLPSAGYAAYVDLNRTSGVAANLSVSVELIEDIVFDEDRLIIASRTSEGVLAGNDAILITDGVTIKLNLGGDPFAANQDRNLKLIEGGEFLVTPDSPIAGTTRLTFDSDAYIQIPGFLNNRNRIPQTESPIDFPNVDDIAYVDINRRDDNPTDLSVVVDSVENITFHPDRIIIGRRVSDGVNVGTGSTKLREGEKGRLDGALPFSPVTIGPVGSNADYITDGLDDQDEFDAAVADFRLANGGEILIFEGSYTFTADHNFAQGNISYRGTGIGTLINVPAASVIATGTNDLNVQNVFFNTDSAGTIDLSSSGIYLFTNCSFGPANDNTVNINNGTNYFNNCIFADVNAISESHFTKSVTDNLTCDADVFAENCVILTAIMDAGTGNFTSSDITEVRLADNIDEALVLVGSIIGSFTQLVAETSTDTIIIGCNITSLTIPAFVTGNFKGNIPSTVDTSGASVNEFLDSLFRINDNTTPTKQLAFEVAAITAATTRTWTVPDVNLNFATSTSGTFATNTLNNLGVTAINTGLIPSSHNAIDIGSSTSLAWRIGYFGTRIEIGADKLRLLGSATSPSGLTVAAISHESTDTLALMTSDSASATRSIVIESGNNTAGGLSSGSISLRAGTATGTRGSINLTGNQLNTTAMAQGKGLPIWLKYTTTHTALQTAATSNNIELFSLPALGTIHGVIISHTAAFTGTGFTSYTVSVGIASNLTKYASAFDVFQATGNGVGQSSNVMDFEDKVSATSIKIAATSVGGNLSASTAGSVDVYVLWSILP